MSLFHGELLGGQRTFFPRLLQSILTHLVQKGRSMDHQVEKGLNDQLDNFLELFRVHPSYYWLLPLC